jgi:hypothetical protein
MSANSDDRRALFAKKLGGREPRHLPQTSALHGKRLIRPVMAAHGPP